LSSSLKIFIHYFELVIFNFLSIITFIKLKLNRVQQVNYYIYNLDEKDCIDPRSVTFKDKLRLNNSLNLLRVSGLKNCFISYFKIPNVIFYNYLFYKNDSLLFILKSLSIKKFTTIDDYRVVENFYIICKELNIYIEAYMHGRFSNKMSSQRVLKKIIFNKYYVWSKYFKKKLLEINNNYSDSSIQIYKKPNLRIIKQGPIKGKINIIYIQENGIDDNFIIKVFNKLLEKRNKLFIKLRKEHKPSFILLSFCKKNNIRVFYNEAIEKIFNAEKINIVIATNSTILLEASYYYIFPIMIRNKKTNLIDLLHDKVVFYVPEIRRINIDILSIIKKNRELVEIRNKVWN
jgi:hypothetical protein